MPVPLQATITLNDHVLNAIVAGAQWMQRGNETMCADEHGGYRTRHQLRATSGILELSLERNCDIVNDPSCAVTETYDFTIEIPSGLCRKERYGLRTRSATVIEKGARTTVETMLESVGDSFRPCADASNPGIIRDLYQKARGKL